LYIHLAQTLGEWFGLAPDDSPMVLRDTSFQEIYALDMKWPREGLGSLHRRLQLGDEHRLNRACARVRF